MSRIKLKHHIDFNLDVSIFRSSVSTQTLRASSQACSGWHEVVGNNPGVIVCGVGLHPNNIATKTVNATTDGNAVWLKFIVPIHMPECISDLCCDIACASDAGHAFAPHPQDQATWSILLLYFVTQHNLYVLHGGATICVFASAHFPCSTRFWNTILPNDLHKPLDSGQARGTVAIPPNSFQLYSRHFEFKVRL